MFPLRYWANRFFNPRYWPVVGAVAAVATVTTRFNLVGTDNQKFSLVGTDNQKFPLVGTDNQKFPLIGS